MEGLCNSGVLLLARLLAVSEGAGDGDDTLFRLISSSSLISSLEGWTCSPQTASNTVNPLFVLK